MIVYVHSIHIKLGIGIGISVVNIEYMFVDWKHL